MPSKKSSAPKGHGWENPLIPHAELQRIYTSLLEARLLNAAIKRSKLPLRKTLLTGHEACIVGTALHLSRADWVAPAAGDAIARSHTQSLAEVICSFVKPQSSTANILPPAGLAYQDWTVANGAALAANDTTTKRDRTVVLAYSGPRSYLSMACLNPLGYASKNNLPIVFISFAGLNAPSTAPGLPTFAQASGVPSFPVDGNDPVAVYRVAQEAILRARSDGGPSFIDCGTFSLGNKKPQDALLFMQKYLDRKGLFSPAWKQQLEREFTARLNKALVIASRSASAKRKR